MTCERGSGDINPTGKEDVIENNIKIKDEINSNDLDLFGFGNSSDIMNYENFKLTNEEIDLKLESADSNDDADWLTHRYGKLDVSKEEILNGTSNKVSMNEVKYPEINDLECNVWHSSGNVGNIELTNQSLENKKNNCMLGASRLIIKLNFNDHYLLQMHKASKLNSGVNNNSRIFKCQYCTYETYRKHYLISHLRSHKDFKCTYCSKEFKSQTAFDNHLLKFHEYRNNALKKLHECDQCTYRTLVKSELAKHKLKHGIKTDSFKILKCCQCTYQTIRKSHLTRHTKTHQNMKDFKCSYCLKEFTRKSSLESHLLTIHNSKHNISRKIHKCDQCSYETMVKMDLTAHILKHGIKDDFQILKCYQCNYQTHFKKHLIMHMRKHTDIKIKCPLCSKQLAKISLDNHLLTIHNCRKLADKIQCDECGYEILNRDELLKHEVKHGIIHSPKILKCYQCSYETFRKRLLTRHMRVHQEDMKCAYCPKKFRHALSLRNHLLKVHKHRDFIYKLYNCDQCTYETLVKKELLAHKLKHGIKDDLQILKCDQCNFETYFKSVLVRHIKAHTSARDFKCTYCSKDYTSKLQLDNHLLKVHKCEHAGKKLYNCNQCNYKTLVKTELMPHKLKHGITDGLQVLKCCKCTYETYRTHNLTRHMEIHNEIKVEMKLEKQ